MIAVSANQMQRVDEIAVRKYGILLVQMMELAGFHLASLIKQKMGGSVVDKRIVILAGKGSNGGGGRARVNDCVLGLTIRLECIDGNSLFTMY